MKENLTLMVLVLERQDGITFTKEGYFFDGRLKPDQVPKGFYKYSIRHFDEDWGDPATLERHVGVNHYGDFLVKEPVEFPEWGYQIKDWSFDDGRSLEVCL